MMEKLHSNPNPNNNPRYVSDDAILTAIRSAVEDGDVDDLEGGVPPEEVAARTKLAQGSASERLYELVRAGKLRKVEGLDPERCRPRRSFLPVDE